MLAMNGIEQGDYAVLPTGGAPQRLAVMGAAVAVVALVY